MENNIENISRDLERYSLIEAYYIKYPFRIEPNENYLLDITDELLDLSEKQMSRETENLGIRLINFFAEISDYII